MANIDCNACEELRQTDPSLLVNGFTDNNCASLKNDTGLVAGSGHDDCNDLDNMNDCLVGNMAAEVETYDVCDWKTFMKRFIPNVWTVIKAIICAICGTWTNIHNLWKKINELCEMMDYQTAPPVYLYGSLVNNTSSPNYGGTIATKDGKAIFIKIAEPVPEAYENNVGVGLHYGKRQSSRCSDGACVLLEWLSPHFYGMRVNPDVELAWMDELWSVDKATVLGWGMTQTTWDKLAIVPISWASDYTALATAFIGIRLSIENDRLVMRYYGEIGASSHAELSGKRIDNPRDGAESVFKSSC